MSEPDATDALDNIIELAHKTEQHDVALSMARIVDTIEEGDDDSEIAESMEELELPFYQEERELAFSIGTYFGAALQEEYGEES